MTKHALFRLAVASLLIAGMIILYTSLHPRHKPPTDDGTFPKLNRSGEPTIAR